MTWTVKNPPAIQEILVDLWVSKVSWRREWQSSPVVLPGESHGQRGPVSPMGSDTIERLERERQDICSILSKRPGT